jgi:hypothetical protein
MMKKMQIIYIFLTILILVGCGGNSTGTESSMTGNTETLTDTVLDPSAEIGSDTTTGDEEALLAVEVVPENWYIRLVAEDKRRELKTESSQLGELAVNDISDKAIKAIGTSSASFIDILFENPDNLEEGTYKSVFKVYDENQEKSWNFSVVTDDENAEVTLSWHGLFVLTPKIDEAGRFSEYRSVSNPLIRQMKLVDTQTGIEVQAIRDGHIMKYSFNMNGNDTREFSWVVATSEVSISIPKDVDKDLKLTTVVQKQAVAPSVKRLETKPKPKVFDFAKPNMPKFN